MFIFTRSEGYGRRIANFFNTDLDPIQKQLERLEFGRILLSRSVGRTRLFSFNPSYPFLAELKSLLEKALSFYPEQEREKLIINRRRPRHAEKPYEFY
jgi:hypothetical protein